MRSSRPTLRPLGWLVLPLALWACHRSSPAGATAGKRYTVRAEVVTLPARPGGELLLRHEAVPGFTDRSGAVVGMRSMLMPFPTAPDVSLAGLAPGDKVEVVFSVDWDEGKYRVERLRELPASTVLELGRTRPMGSTGSHAPGDAMK